MVTSTQTSEPPISVAPGRPSVARWKLWLCLILCLCTVATAPGSHLKATTFDAVTLTCPVCGDSCEGTVITSTNFLGGQDRDLLLHSAGGSPFLFLPVTCLGCLFSARIHEFENPVAEETKQAILNDSLLTMMRWAGPDSGMVRTTWVRRGSASDTKRLPAWKRFDLLIQVQEHDKASKSELIRLYLYAAWAVRLQLNPFTPYLLDLDKDESAWVQARSDSLEDSRGEDVNRAEVEIQVARSLLDELPDYPKDRERTALVYSCHALREHGEHRLLLSAYPRLKDHLSDEDWIALDDIASRSISLEMYYQRHALTLCRELIFDTETENKETLAMLQYMAGELARRVGMRDLAITHFDAVIEMDDAPEDFRTWAVEQRVLCLDR